MPLEPLLSRLIGVRPRGHSAWVARCPAHEDKKPSLSIRELPDGRILLHDFAGCEVEDVLTAVGLQLSDLMPPRALEHRAKSQPSAHAHAAAEALGVIAHEAFLVTLAARDMSHGVMLPPADLARLYEAAIRIRHAAHLTAPPL